VVSPVRPPPLLHAEHLVVVDLQLQLSGSRAFVAEAAGAGVLAARGRRAWGPSPPAEQVLEPVHQPRLEAPRVAVPCGGAPGADGRELLAVPKPAARDPKAGGLARRAVDRGGAGRGLGLLLLLGAAQAGAEARELALEGLDAEAGGLHGRADVRGLAQRGVALEDVAERHAGGVPRDAAAEGAREGRLEDRRCRLPRRRCGGVVVVAEEHGVVGVELLDEHGLHDEAERQARVLDQVHEEMLRQLGAVDVVAQPSLVLLRQLPLVVLHKHRCS
jgi:hypothetical protein